VASQAHRPHRLHGRARQEAASAVRRRDLTRPSDLGPVPATRLRFAILSTRNDPALLPLDLAHQAAATASVAGGAGQENPGQPVSGYSVSPPATPRRPRRRSPPRCSFLRAALRMYDLMGYLGFVLTLMNAYTGARWSELISQKPGLYDPEGKRIPVRHPIREAAGRFEEAPRPKSPAGRRAIQLPPFLAIIYEALLADSCHRLVFTGQRGAVLRRSNFARRFWRPAWDGDPDNTDPGNTAPDKRAPAVLTGFTFHEGRHTHRTWLADDNIPDVVRAARLGHKLPGMADVYEHVTPAMEKAVRDALTRRWKQSVRQLTDTERQHLAEIVPAELRPSITKAGKKHPKRDPQ
jgi:integrase